jgi:hypothetical protein
MDEIAAVRAANFTFPKYSTFGNRNDIPDKVWLYFFKVYMILFPHFQLTILMAPATISPSTSRRQPPPRITSRPRAPSHPPARAGARLPHPLGRSHCSAGEITSRRETAIFHTLMTLEQDPARFLAFDESGENVLFQGLSFGCACTTRGGRSCRSHK